MQNTENSDRRDKIRVDFKTRIILKVGKEEIHAEGNSRNLSLSGMFVNTSQSFSIGQRCVIEVLLTGVTEKIALEMEGRIVRNEAQGIAVTFDSMDLDSYARLKNIVRYNSSESE